MNLKTKIQVGLLRFNLWRNRKRTLGSTARDAARKFGERTFLWFEEDQYTFAGFNNLANQWANYFHDRGVRKGDVVCLLMENRPEYLFAMTGLSKLGAVTAAINTNLVDEALSHSINLSGAEKIIIGGERLAPLMDVMNDLVRISPAKVYVHTRWPGAPELPANYNDLNSLLPEVSEAEPPDAEVMGRNLLMYIYTSGTTGLPKAANISHFRWVRVGDSQQTVLGLTTADRVYCTLPLYHSNGILIAFGGALVSGAGLILVRKFSASRFWEEAHRYGATALIYIGELLRYLVNSPPGAHDRNHSITKIFGNGLRGDIWPAFQERFGVMNIREFYASTEGNVSTVNMDNIPGSVGKVGKGRYDNLALLRWDGDSGEHMRNEKGRLIPCEAGEVGEMLGEITPLSPFPGYTNMLETEKKLIHNVFREGDVYFRTGDLLRQDNEGYYYFIDRIGDTFRWKGENVSTEEVQKILSGFDGVSLANVYGVTIPGTDGRAGMAALSLKNGDGLDGRKFFSYIQDHLPVYSRPAFVRLVEEMEVTGTFKVRKPELQKEGYDPALVNGPLFFRDDSTGDFLPVDQEIVKKIQKGEIRF